MATWRAEASSQAQADVDELIDAALAQAKKELAKHGEFHPFGAKILRDGTVKTFAAQDLPGDTPKTLDLRALFLATLLRKRDHLRAAALIAQGSDGKAIELEVDHADGPSLAVRVPYERAFFGRKVTLGEPEVTPAAPFIWGPT